MRAQFERMNLLHHITRAVGERQDLPSIFQVVVGTLEDEMPLDFACMCLYRRGDQRRGRRECRAAQHGARDAAGAQREQRRSDIGDDCIAKAARGQLIYEPDTQMADSPFPAAARAGRVARDGRGAAAHRGQGFRRARRGPVRGEQLQQRRMRIPHAVERARGARRATGGALQRVAGRLRRPAPTRRRPPCNRNACARSGRWRVASRTTSTTRSRRWRSTPIRCSSAKRS